MQYVHGGLLLWRVAGSFNLLVLLLIISTPSSLVQQAPASGSAPNAISRVSNERERQVRKADAATDCFTVFRGQGTFAYTGTPTSITGTGRAGRVVPHRDTM